MSWVWSRAWSISPSFSRMSERYPIAARTLSRSFTSRRSSRLISSNHAEIRSSSAFACSCRLMEYCAFHAAASALRLYLSGAVSRESAPMLWTAGIFWISVSTATYLGMWGMWGVRSGVT